MESPEDSDRGIGKLIEALEWHDEQTRKQRAVRIAWVSSVYQHSGLVMGPATPLNLMNEARGCYIAGQFTMVALASMSVIEHLLMAKLEGSSSVNAGIPLKRAISKAASDQLYPPDLLQGADILRKLRNSLVHKNAEVEENDLFERYLKNEVHPDTLKEADAQFSLKLMYGFFLASIVRRE